jgi:hypothetical protein
MNDFATKTATTLFGRFPEWRQYQTSRLPLSTVESRGSEDELFVEVPAPIGSLAGSLRIYTEDEEVWIGFSKGQGDHSAEYVGYSDFLRMIDQFLSGALRVAVCKKGSEYRWSELLECDEEPTPAFAGETVEIIAWPRPER